MRIVYVPSKTTPEKLARVIGKLGYETRVSDGAASSVASGDGEHRAGGERIRASMPNDGPAFLVQEFKKARKAKRPVVLDFMAEWCAPCLQLKKETLQNADVARMLAKVELVYIDLDAHPRLGELYDVASVPNVVFIDRDGLVVDRLTTFEPPSAFLARLKRLLGE